jgi:hypothetical protein
MEPQPGRSSFFEDASQSNSHSVESLMRHIRALPLPDQLELLERIAVAVLPDLDEDDRSDFIDELNLALSRALPEEAETVSR